MQEQVNDEADRLRDEVIRRMANTPPKAKPMPKQKTPKDKHDDAQPQLGE